MAVDQKTAKHQPMEVRHVQYPGPNTGGRPIYDDRINLEKRRPVSVERTDL
jgi:hypothetical protein